MGGVVQFANNVGTTSPLNATFGATPTPGNTILVVACSDTDVTLTSGVTRRANQIANDDYEVGTRLVQGGDGSAWGCTGGSGFNTAVIIVEVDGVYDAVGTVAHTAGSQGSTISIASLTPGAGTITALAVAGAHNPQSAANGTVTPSVDNGFTKVDGNWQGGTAATADGAYVAKKEGLAGSSAIGATTVTLSTNNSDRDGVLVSFIDNTSVPMVYARPSADTVTTGWSDAGGGTTNLFTDIDETSASDADYVKATS